MIASLPQIGAPAGQIKPYGFVWVENSTQDSPFAHSPVGLTLAGVWQLAHAGRIHPALPDQFATVMAALAAWDSNLTAKPHALVEESRALEQFTAPLRDKLHDRPYSVPDSATARLLSHEYLPINAGVASPPSPAVVSFGRRSLREYQGITSAQEYLDLVEARDAAHANAQFHHSPMPLVQTMDYLGYVLKAEPSWTADRLTAAPDLQAASALTGVATNADEFQTLLSGLCTIIDQFKVPAVPDDVAAERFDNRQPPTITRFQYWLNVRLGDSAGADHVASAIKILRLLKDIRTEAQHSSLTTRKRARDARIALGLADPILDWSSAWQTVLDRVAGALDLIRAEVAVAPMQ